MPNRCASAKVASAALRALMVMPWLQVGFFASGGGGCWACRLVKVWTVSAPARKQTAAISSVRARADMDDPLQDGCDSLRRLEPGARCVSRQSLVISH